MLTLVTHSQSIFSKENLKQKLAHILGKKRGPFMVAESLTRGLSELGTHYHLNPILGNWSSTTHIVSGIKALERGIELKKQGHIKKLIAGPALVVTPFEHNRIIRSSEIDLIIQPSHWVKDFYISQSPELASKLRVWPAGVRDPGTYSKRDTNHAIVYYKNGSVELLERVVTNLKKRNITFTILEYGSFKQEEYYALLEKSDFVVYLSHSESQGIALNEAWIRDVPTLVWSRGVWNYGKYSWKDPLISAPYLTKETGVVFNEENFEENLNNFIVNIHTFSPRAHSLTNWTDTVCAQKYLDIINL